MLWTAPPRARKCHGSGRRCRGHLRSCHEGQHAVRGDQDARAPKTRGTKMSTKSKDLAPKGVQRPRHGELLPFMNQFTSYLVDVAQRNVLFWDVMRRRSSQYQEHIAKTAPHVLDFKVELVMDGRTLERPANYVLARIGPPAGFKVDSTT